MSADELVSAVIERVEAQLHYDLFSTSVRNYNIVMRSWDAVRASLLCAAASCGLPQCTGPESHLERLPHVG